MSKFLFVLTSDTLRIVAHLGALDIAELNCKAEAQPD